jgi:hypothetical protein
VFAATHVPLHEPQEILERMRDWHRETGTPPSVADWSLSSAGSLNRYEREYPRWPAASSVQATFGSWRAAVRAAGLTAQRADPWTRQDVIQALRDSAARLGRSPTVADTRTQQALPSEPSVRRLFATWNAALRAARLPVTRVSPRRWEAQSIIQALRALADTLGRAPTYAELERSDRARYPSPQTVAKHFGSWQAGLSAAGLAPAGRAARWDRQAVIAALRRFERERGRAPQARDLAGVHDRERWPAPQTVARRFGSWSNGLRAAGLS